MTTALAPYFRDVMDHVMRIGELVDKIRDLLMTLLEVRIAQAANRLNEVMKKLTAWAGDHPGADADRRDLRHELPGHARARAGGSATRSRSALMAGSALGLYARLQEAGAGSSDVPGGDGAVRGDRSRRRCTALKTGGGRRRSGSWRPARRTSATRSDQIDAERPARPGGVRAVRGLVALARDRFPGMRIVTDRDAPGATVVATSAGGGAGARDGAPPPGRSGRLAVAG